MSRRLGKSWVVPQSFENPEANRCVDIFYRPDGTWGFEEFRKDPEDNGVWTPITYYSGQSFGSNEEALNAARRAVVWFGLL